MTRFEHSVVIERPLEEVWAYVTEVGNNPVWQGPIIEVRRGAVGPLDLGTEIEEVAHFLGKRFEITLEVIEHDPPKRCAVRTAAGPVRLDGTYSFSTVDGGTRFSTEGEVEASGFFKLAEPVFARMARREWVSSCENLKDVLEADAASSAP